MTDKTPIRKAATADLPALRELLVAARLPADDLGEARVRFVVAEEGQRIVGAGAFEPLAPGVALVRSFVVAPDRRRAGLGAALLAQVVAEARDHGVGELYLLTTTAQPFFAAQGFAALPRERAPESVRAHGQFTGLCPRTATVMHRPLDRELAGAY